MAAYLLTDPFPQQYLFWKQKNILDSFLLPIKDLNVFPLGYSMYYLFIVYPCL